MSLVLEHFGVAFGEHVVLRDITFSLPAHGMTVLVGPVAGGKSTLLRTLAGLNDAHPSLGTWGTATLEGRALSPGHRPTLVTQHARFFLDTVRENLVSAFSDRESLDHSAQTHRIASHRVSNGPGCRSFARSSCATSWTSRCRFNGDSRSRAH